MVRSILPISVIVPVYQVESYISDCLSSLYCQTQPVSVLAVDDGSSDLSSEIIDTSAFQNSDIVVVHKWNEGVTRARFTGVILAETEYIGFCDGDDLVEPAMYEVLLRNLMEYQADISHCGHQVLHLDGTVEYYLNTGRLVLQDNEEGVKSLLCGSFEPGLWSKLYRKSLLHSLLHSNHVDCAIKWFEDLLINFYLFREAGKTVYEDVCLYHYKKRENSASQNTVSQQKFWDPLKVKRIIYEELKNTQLEQTACTAWMEMYVHLYNILLRSPDKNIKLSKHRIQKEIREHYSSIKWVTSRKNRILLRMIGTVPVLYDSVYHIYRKKESGF